MAYFGFSKHHITWQKKIRIETTDSALLKGVLNSATNTYFIIKIFIRRRLIVFHLNQQEKSFSLPNTTFERVNKKLNLYLSLERGKVGCGTICLCKLDEERSLPAGWRWSVYLGKGVQSGNTKARDSPCELHLFVILSFPKSCSNSKLGDVVTPSRHFFSHATNLTQTVSPTVTEIGLRVLAILQSNSPPK